MYPILATLYGPIAIHSYGLAIAVGIWVFIWCIERAWQNTPHMEMVQKAVIPCIGAGIIGGKLLYVAEAWYAGIPLSSEHVLGGFSLLGSVIAVMYIAYRYIHNLTMPLINTFDTIACYAPILHIFGRIGCFLAGCCHGVPGMIPWAIIYTHEMSLAPCNIPLHPTQLYSAGIHIIVFGILLYLRRYHIPGLITAVYCISLGLERFCIDFWRADHQMLAAYMPFSTAQCLSLIFICGGLLYALRCYYYQPTEL